RIRRDLVGKAAERDRPGGYGGRAVLYDRGGHGGSSPRLIETGAPVRADSYTARTISSASRPAWPSTAGARPSSTAASRSAICAAWLATSIAAGSAAAPRAPRAPAAPAAPVPALPSASEAP